MLFRQQPRRTSTLKAFGEQSSCAAGQQVGVSKSKGSHVRNPTLLVFEKYQVGFATWQPAVRSGQSDRMVYKGFQLTAERLSFQEAVFLHA